MGLFQGFYISQERFAYIAQSSEISCDEFVRIDRSADPGVEVSLLAAFPESATMSPSRQLCLQEGMEGASFFKKVSQVLRWLSI